MKALVWPGVRVETVPDPALQEPPDAIVRVYEVLGPFMEPGDILGHEPIGIVEEVGPEARHIRPGGGAIDPLLLDGDPLATDDLATHRLPLDDAPRGYELFQNKEDGAIKVVLEP